LRSGQTVSTAMASIASAATFGNLELQNQGGGNLAEQRIATLESSLRSHDDEFSHGLPREAAAIQARSQTVIQDTIATTGTRSDTLCTSPREISSSEGADVDWIQSPDTGSASINCF
jgi:hypothetical protein